MYTLQIVIAAILLIWLIVIVGNIKKKKIDLRYALAWIALIFVGIILDIFPGILGALADLIGIEIPSNMIFMAAIILLLVLVYSLTATVSRLSDKVKKLRKEYDYYERIEKLSKEKDLSFEEITYRACDIIGDVMEKHLMDIQKINFDFGSLAVNSPERMAKIMEGASGQGITEKIGIYIFPKMVEAAMKQGYQMKGTPEEIIVFISAAFSGIEKCCILQANYVTGSHGVKFEPKAAFRTLAKSIILLFGGTVNE